MLPAFEESKQLVKSIHPISQEDLEIFSSIWKPFSAKRNEGITRAEEKEHFLYFVMNRVQFFFYKRGATKKLPKTVHYWE